MLRLNIHLPRQPYMVNPDVRLGSRSLLSYERYIRLY
jgi:hypothetical protein